MSLNLFEKQFEELTGLRFSEFYMEYKPKLVWHLSTMTKDLELAEDFAQEAFIQGLKNLHLFNPEKSQIHTWITTIGRHIVIKEWKDKQKLPSNNIEDDSEDKCSIITFLPSEEMNEINEEEELLCYKADIIKNAIDSLPEKYRLVMTLREIDNLPYKDISKQLNINLSTIKSQILKGRKLIISIIEKKFEYLDNNGIN